MANDQAIARFEREMLAVGKLEHPNIVRAYDAGEIDGSPYLAMEYVEGIDLSHLVKHCGPLPIADACELVRQAAMGLEHAHQHGLVHRDVKPSNLMLVFPPEPSSDPAAHEAALNRWRREAVKLLDLGLARLAEHPSDGTTELTGAGMVMGTVDYMAPEQVTDPHGVDHRADVYSLGATLYKLLAGQAPFDELSTGNPVQKLFAASQRPPVPIQERRSDVPPELAELVQRLLEKDPAARFQSAAQVAEALEPFAAGCDLARRYRRAAA